MKILPVIGYKPISFDNKVKREENQQKSENKTTVTIPFQSYLGLDLVSFKSRNFNDTLNENYFKLKEGFEPDKFQKEAGWHINKDKSVLVTAPTGTGKTAIAQYAISKNMYEGKKTFYTTPLKALSNQKYRELKEAWGQENVGILTGDRKENPDAPILVMTTEVYRNMALSKYFGQKAELMNNLGTVIFDEFHYLDDDERGPVWEESVIFTPQDVRTLALSATIGNAREITNWMDSLSGKNSELVYVPPRNRHVPLIFETFNTNGYTAPKKSFEKKSAPSSSETQIIDKKNFESPMDSDFKKLTTVLKQKNQLPAIFFIFNRKYTFELASYFGKEGDDLTTDEEKREIKNIMAKYRAENFSSLDTKALMKGYAVHNAGILPDQKAMVEELFQKRLIKVALATETLGAGLNMPAKTVVISQPIKPDPKSMAKNKTEQTEEAKIEVKKGKKNKGQEEKKKAVKRLLTANEFHQMAGRAGRRGIDDVGYVYVMNVSPQCDEAFSNLIESEPDPISSKFSPSFSFLANIYDYSQNTKDLKSIMDKSFYSQGNHALTGELFASAMKNTALLTKRGFLTNKDGEYSLTDKGRLLSVIKGYSQLQIAEAVYDKYFEGLSPLALASVIGAIANPSNIKEKKYDANDVQNPQEKKAELESGISSLYERMLSTVKNNLNYVGDKQFGDFNNMQEIVRYLYSVKLPDEDIDELREKSQHYTANLEKLDKLKEPYQSWTLESVAKAIREGQTISVEAMEACHNKLQGEIKKYGSIDYITKRINQAETRLKAIDIDSRKGSEKRKYRIEVQDLKYEIEHLGAIKFLDENLETAMSDADKFIKANNYKATEALAKKYTDMYNAAANLKKLRIAANGCLHIQRYNENHDIGEEDRENTEATKVVMDKLVDLSKSIQNDAISEDTTIGSIGLGKTSMELVYDFAQLNKINPDSMSNWLQILSNMLDINDNFDEGQFFYSVAQTIDLLSQISEMASVGKQFSETKEDIHYYTELKENAAEAIKLLNNYPVVFN